VTVKGVNKSNSEPVIISHDSKRVTVLIWVLVNRIRGLNMIRSDLGQGLSAGFYGKYDGSLGFKILLATNLSNGPRSGV
jgi:hypothetical protein